MRADAAKVVIYNAYQPERTAKSVATEVDGAAVKLAHMPDSLPGTATYVDTLTYNVKSLAQALRTTAATETAK
jgi:ABC-type Zn uptake system ZnuABC Zn-binding protein ZnuA